MATAAMVFMDEQSRLLSSAKVLESRANSNTKGLILLRDRIENRDFINSFNHTVSGSFGLANRHKAQPLSPGKSCVANAWITQVSVQAVDFNILIISIVVLLCIRQQKLASQPSMKRTVLLCVIAWIPGLITSFTGLILNAYGPVSGNWCWIKPDLLGLRYLLTHGWRIAIFLATIGIYTYVYIHLKRVYGNFTALTTANAHSTVFNDQDLVDNKYTLSTSSHDGRELLVSGHIMGRTSCAVSRDSERQFRECKEGMISISSHTQVLGSKSQSLETPQTTRTEQISPLRQPKGQGQTPSIEKILLLNGYPILYIVLWIPGMFNRALESTIGSPDWLKALQSTTQFVGLANAFTYGYNEQLRQRWRCWLKPSQIDDEISLTQRPDLQSRDQAWSV
ncbi:hypothetical protein EPUS_06855 [Endocarpon pusillum Z07020]|uniref:Glucose receptor Git3-like N-terminal domain-containing protein n=1 Tax=Endocarpon pusillum (strain Z07020 / HMAS-L-300199) TaxID=1263415 RepID=U1GH23_ENDPU|nr:uncharacterized protein EPUS_06855 [Endocarpon pusillum Z07020]ERF76987.1 hypothetical protein EPUS_06855 [Endocarpon pusillum Z07020]